MRLNGKATALALGLLWGGGLFILGIAHLIWPAYGIALLDVASSIYPGYHVGGFGSAIVGGLYGFVDAGVGGIILAWLYNAVAGGSAAA